MTPFGHAGQKRRFSQPLALHLSPIRKNSCYKRASECRFAGEWISYMKTRKELHPSGLVPEALSAQVLSFMNQRKLHLLELAAAADVIAADCRYNYWMASEVKEAGLSEGQWLYLLDACEIAHDRCRAAMAAFDSGGAPETLRNELAAVAAFLSERTL
jgi:hypothetical protein